jgi:hypothetical protein
LEDGCKPPNLGEGHLRNGRKVVSGVACLQGVEESGMTGPGETLGSSWIPLAIRASGQRELEIPETYVGLYGARSPRSAPLLSFYAPGAGSGNFVKKNMFYQSQRERDKRIPSPGSLSDSVMPQSEIVNTYCADTSISICSNRYLTQPSYDSTII